MTRLFKIQIITVALDLKCCEGVGAVDGHLKALRLVMGIQGYVQKYDWMKVLFL